jgi:hypothetical protein
MEPHSPDEIPEPHEFTVTLTHGAATASVRFEEHAHPKTPRIATTTCAPPWFM